MSRKTEVEEKPSHDARLTRHAGMWSFEFSEEMHGIQRTLYHIAESIPKSPSNAERKLLSIIRRHPYAFDAYDQLAYIYSRSQRNQWRDLLENGLAKFRELIPNEFVIGKSTLPWAIVENRPFLRMYMTLGTLLKATGETERAKAMFHDLIGMNPDDNQGVREPLCSCYFQLGESDAVLSLCRKYKDDGTPAITFGKVLALFKEGRMYEAKKAFKNATQYQSNITREIMAGRHRKLKDAFSPYEPGSKREAELYWEEFGAYWDTAAVKFFRDQAEL